MKTEHKPIFAETVCDLVRRPDYPYYSLAAAQKIAAAKRFVLSDSALEAALNLIRHKPEVLLQMTDLARLPFPLMWIEYSGKKRYYAKDVEFGSTDDDKPDHCGYLIEATNNTMLEGKASLFQGRRMSSSDLERYNQVTCSYGEFVATSLFSWAFDYSAAGNPDHMLADVLHNGMFQDLREHEIENGIKWFALQGKEIAESAIREMHRRDIRIPCPYANRFISLVASGGRGDISVTDEIIKSPQFERFVRINISTMRGDNFLLRAILALMNSRKNWQYEPVEYEEKLLRLRERKGQKQWLGHSVIKFDFSDHQKNSMRAAGMSEEDIRAHFVRGHFKVRKSGVFFWRPHIRGSLSEGFVDGRYEVKTQNENEST